MKLFLSEKAKSGGGVGRGAACGPSLEKLRPPTDLSVRSKGQREKLVFHQLWTSGSHPSPHEIGRDIHLWRGLEGTGKDSSRTNEMAHGPEVHRSSPRRRTVQQLPARTPGSSSVQWDPPVTDSACSRQRS